MRPRAAWLSVLATEVLQLVRDRRALFASVLLPALLYPVLFWTNSKIERQSRELLESRTVSVGVDLGRLDAQLADRVRAALAARAPIDVFDVDAAALLAPEPSDGPEPPPDEAARAARRAIVQELCGLEGDAIVTGMPVDGPGGRSALRVYFDVKQEDAREASSRAEAALSEVRTALARERRAELLPSDPALGLDLESVDVASARDQSGARLGRFLPLIALVVLVSGGSYAALATFAGEREGGTLETLLVQPVPARAVVWGKYLAVFAAGLVTLIANLASLGVCARLGLMGDTAVSGTGPAGLGLARLLGTLVYLPGCALVCALLCLVCGRARTFRHGQTTILPVLLLTAVPTAISAQPGLETTPLLAAVPFTGAALVLRDVLRGEPTLVALLVMVLSHLVWTGLLLSRLAGVLDAERVLSTADTDAESGLRHAASRHAQRWGFVAVLATYVIGGELQRRDLRWGLFATLWILLPALAYACARRARRPERTTVARELSLTRPSVLHLLGALLVVPGVAFAMQEWVLPLQMRLLPLPASALSAEGLEAALSGMGTPLLLFLFALSPGVGEELLFRGALLSSLRRDLSPARAVLWQAVFFAAAHASIYRLIPTALMGVVLGTVTLRARSLWPAVLLHAGYDAWTIAGSLGRLPEGLTGWPGGALAGLAVVGTALLARPGGTRSR